MNERTKQTMTLSELTQAISDRIGVLITGDRSNQSGWSIQHGYARIRIPSETTRFISSHCPFLKEQAAFGRKEGDDSDHPTETQTLTLDPNEDWREKLISWAADILSTGRTVECGKGIGLDEIRKDTPRGFSLCDHDMAHIHRLLSPETNPKYDLDLNPDYQRDHVWTDEQASSFVGFLIKTGGSGSPHTPLIFIQENKDYTREVIDGKQRLTAIRRWVDGEIPAQVDDKTFWFKDTNEVDRRLLPNVKVAFVTLTRRQRLHFYLMLNAGGTVHTKEEIDKVRVLLAQEDET